MPADTLSGHTPDVSPDPQPDRHRLQAALARATQTLLAARTPDGHWAGRLSSSALSTATAIIALAVSQRARRAAPNRVRESEITDFKSEIASGLHWLARNQNADGGWGDTPLSLSNISTSTLCWAALGAVPGADKDYSAAVTGAEKWLAAQTVRLPSTLNPQPSSLVSALLERYGSDRTFSAPILTACALAGRLGTGTTAWRHVPALPFELAACPHQWFAALRLPVVSYALPALIAIGQARHFHLPSRNPFARLARSLLRRRTLRVLTHIQPGNGGFLEATPLTSFVVMSLAGSGQPHHPVTTRGIEFLLKSQRADGSWPIDTNLATWVTTLAVDAMANGPPDYAQSEIENQNAKTCTWLLLQQHRIEHPYTHSPPGGWAWTDLPGGVPDADDTAGAVLALARARAANLGDRTAEGRPDEMLAAARAGIVWLLNLQNRDGGLPTFCRGWGTLPFDRSSADLTAHALRAWLAWREHLPPRLQGRIDAAVPRALRFLEQAQRPDGPWVPLWFGNQFAPADENPTYGTARVLRALRELPSRSTVAHRMLARGASWLLAAQHPTGGWGGAPGVPISVEETALAVEALAPLLSTQGLPAGIPRDALQAAVQRGATWLVQRVESGDWTRPSPIGFYFARLWYSETLYPQIFTVAALAQVLQIPPPFSRP